MPHTSKKHSFNGEAVINGAIAFLSRNPEVDPEVINCLKKNGGFCGSLNVLWGFAGIQTYFVLKETGDGPRKLDDFAWFFKCSDRLQAFYEDPSILLSLTDEEAKEIERFIEHILFLQTVHRYLQTTPITFEKHLEYLNSGNHSMTTEFMLGGEFTRDHLQNILPMIIKKGRWFYIGSGSHATSLIYTNGKYVFFNPISGPHEFDDSDIGLKNLIDRIFIAQFSKNKNELPLNFKSIYFGSNNFVKELNKTPEYPDKKWLLENFSTGNGLYVAAETGCLESVKYLLTTQKDCEQGVYYYENTTPLYVACQNGHVEIVKELLKVSRIDINKKNKAGEAALTSACAKGYVDIVKELLKEPKIDVNIKNSSGGTPLIFACQNGDIEIAKELLKNSQLDVNCMNESGGTALILACQNGDIDIVKELLNNSKIDVNKSTKEGMSPLSIACCNGHYEIIEILLADPKIIIDAEFLLSVANTYIFYWLLERKEILVDDGMSLLLNACVRGHHKVVGDLLRSYKINLHDQCGVENLLFLACKNGQHKVVAALLESEKFKIEKLDENIKSYFEKYLRQYIMDFINPHDKENLPKKNWFANFVEEFNGDILKELFKIVQNVDDAKCAIPNQNTKISSVRLPLITYSATKAKLIMLFFAIRTNLIKPASTESFFTIAYWTSTRTLERSAEALFQNELSVGEACKLFQNITEQKNLGPMSLLAVKFSQIVADLTQNFNENPMAKHLNFIDFINLIQDNKQKLNQFLDEVSDNLLGTMGMVNRKPQLNSKILQVPSQTYGLIPFFVD
jgi:ankyrin repeat protein